MKNSADKAVLSFRSGVIQAIRSYFTERGFIEVETPVLIDAPAQEEYIEAEPVRSFFLRTSPELQMKRLLAAGLDRIFQIGPCFRSGEKGRLHNPEFTMLEWYRAYADYVDAMADTKSLVAYVANKIIGKTEINWNGEKIELMPIWDVITIKEAFIQHAGWDPVLNFDSDLFDMDMAEKIEPLLEKNRPVILKDYPAERAALAKLKAEDPSVAERWELYIGGIELANAFSELTDPKEQLERFERAAIERARLGKIVYPIDIDFIADMKNMPPCFGVAFGIDRFVMLLAGQSEISSVRSFVSC